MAQLTTEHRIWELEKAAIGAPDEPALEDELAEAYLEAGAFHDKALRVYERVLAREPTRADMNQALCVAHLAVNVQNMIRDPGAARRPGAGLFERVQPENVEDNIDLIDGWLEKHDHSPDLWKARGDLLMLRGRFPAAVEAYRRACDRGLRPTARVLETVRRVMERVPMSGEPALYFAELALDNGQDELADSLLNAALSQPYPAKTNQTTEPGDAPSHRLPPERARRATGLLCDLIERRRAHETSKRERDRMAARVARLRLDGDDLDGAVAALNRISIEDCEQPELVKRLARRLFEAGDARQAFDYLTRLPLDAEVKAQINAIGVALERRGEYDTAAYLMEFVKDNDAVIQQARRLKGREREAMTQMRLGDLYRDDDRPRRALERYVAVLRMGCSDPDEVLGRVEAILGREDFGERDAELTGLLMELGDYFSGAGRLDKAVETYQRALSIDGDNPQCRQALRRLYDRALADNPNRPLIRLRSGELFSLCGDINKAIAEYKRAALFPQCETEASRRLAEAYIRSRNYSLALDCYAGVALEARDLASLYELLDALEDVGLYHEAIKAADLIRGLDGDYLDVKLRVKRIDERIAQAGPNAFIDPKMKKLIGDQAVGQYRYLEKIGGGGMGVVHKVFDARRQIPVAMKILREGLTQSNKAIDRFFREARIAAALNHPNIVMVFDYNINAISGRSYMVMEFVNGPSLRDRVEERLEAGLEITLDSMTEDLYYIAQLCDALEATHRKGVIHRDIKPDNILVNERLQVKITDFGIMHMEDATVTPTGALVGTPRYMAPEQVQGRHISHLSDVYSVGIILYELLVGTPPFVSGDVPYQQLHVDPTPPIDILPDIPVEVNDLVLKCLEKQPEDRPQSAMALKLDVERLLGGVLSPQYERLLARVKTTSGGATL